MRNRWLFIVIGAAFLILIWLANVARHNFIQKPLVDGESVLFAPSYQLSNSVDDDLVVLADNIHLEQTSTVDGDVALLGSKVVMDGSVDGDLAVMGEQLTIGENARIDGDSALLVQQVRIDGTVDGEITLVGDNLIISPDARLNAPIYACVENITNGPDVSIEPCEDHMSAEDYAFFDAMQKGDYTRMLGMNSGDFSGGGLLLVVLNALALSGVAVLAVTLFPRHIANIRAAVSYDMGKLAGVGCLTMILAAAVIVIFTILVSIAPVALILMPFILLGGLLVLGMLIAGWVTLALIVGDTALRRAAHTTFPPLVTVAVGGVVLFLGWGLLGLLPLGEVIQFFTLLTAGSVGLGAALQTRMGTRPLLPAPSRRLVQG